MQATRQATPQFEVRTFSLDGKPRQIRVRSSLRTMFGREMLPFISTAAILESLHAAETGECMVGTEQLLERIQREYFDRWGTHLPARQLADCAEEWMHMNTDRLRKLAEELGDRFISKTIKEWTAIRDASEKRRQKILAENA